MRIVPRLHSVLAFGLLMAAAPPALAQRNTGLEAKLWTIPGLVKALDARPGSRLAEVGAGDGFFSEQLAQAVLPGGRVTAEDISERSLERLRQRIQRNALTNIDVLEGKLDDPLLDPGAFDGVLIRNAYHEMKDYASILRGIHAALKPGGRLVIVEPITEKRRELPRDEQTASHEIAIKIVEQDIAEAGFVVLERNESFDKSSDAANAEVYWLLVVTKPLPDPTNPRPN
ncbi:MAG: class I SAM-dependent methyltransferase [Vicinamibacteria bacterium]|nr:class I SAM-dependent methyltransferase [Vicinamibacteria bacterium]